MLDPARIALFLASLLAAASLRADISLPSSVPPQADAGFARVLRGGEVAIELKGHYGGAGTVAFDIVRPPSHGALSRLQAREGNRATIIYTHSESHPETSDDFTYVIRAGGGRVSSPAIVRIEVEEPPPKLQTVGALDFGDVLAGGSVARELPITNAGGGVLQGKIRASSPWRTLPVDFRVEAGKTATVQVDFQPNEARDFVGQVTLTDEAGNPNVVSLSGKAEPALRVSPSTLLFASEPRRETLSLTNLTEAPIQLKFQTSPHLKSIEEVALPAGETKDVAVEVRQEVAGPIHEALVVSAPRSQVSLVVEIPALPPRIATATATPTPTSTPVMASSTPLPTPSSSPAPELPPITDTSPPTESGPFVKVTARRLGASLWELKWAARKIPSASYRIEERTLSLDAAGNLQTSWRPVTSTINPALDPVTAKLAELDADRVHVIRVTALDASGTTLWESPPEALAAVPATTHERGLWLVSLSLALAVCLFLRWRAR